MIIQIKSQAAKEREENQIRALSNVLYSLKRTSLLGILNIIVGNVAEHGEAWPSQRKMGKKLKVCRQWVNEGCQLLKALGLLNWHRRWNASNVYRLPACFSSPKIAEVLIPYLPAMKDLLEKLSTQLSTPETTLSYSTSSPLNGVCISLALKDPKEPGDPKFITNEEKDIHKRVGDWKKVGDIVINKPPAPTSILPTAESRQINAPTRLPRKDSLSPECLSIFEEIEKRINEKIERNS
jgi:hypothetical protein